MAVMTDSLQRQVRDILAGVPEPVTLVAFTHPADADLRELVTQLGELSNGRIVVEVHDFDGAAELARQYGIDKAPELAVLGGTDGRTDLGVRFFGTPRGYEFGTLIEDVRMAAAAHAGLSEQTLDVLANLTSPVHLQVFVTAACPYCPRAVLLAHKLAIASHQVKADAVDASEFEELADRYGVFGVPHTVINDRIHVPGAVSEEELVAELTTLMETTS